MVGFTISPPIKACEAVSLVIFPQPEIMKSSDSKSSAGGVEKRLCSPNEFKGLEGQIYGETNVDLKAS